MRESSYRKLLANWEGAQKVWEKDKGNCKKPSKPRKPKEMPPLPVAKLKELPSLTDNRFWHKLGLMSCGVEYGTAAKSSEKGDVPVLRMGNIQNGEFDWTDLVYTSDRCEIDKYSLAEGDVLFNRTNSPELVGKTAIYRGQSPALFAGYLIRVNHIESVVDSRYLNYFLNSHFARQHGKSVKTDGVNQSNINGEKLSNYPFPYCSLAEQQEIAGLLDEKVSVVDKIEADIQGQLKSLFMLRQGVLQKAFSGQLVSQDPSDKPASVLLEQIRVEREAAEDASKTKMRRARKRKVVKTMADLLKVLKTRNDWISAQEAFRQCGIADGAETDAIEQLYEELRGHVKAEIISVERRGDEDWLRLRQGQEA